MFCLRCGGKRFYKCSEENPNTGYKYIYTCKSAHDVLTNNHPTNIPEGMKPVRTKASNGFQTSFIPIEEKESDWKDKDFHSVNIFFALISRQ